MVVVGRVFSVSQVIAYPVNRVFVYATSSTRQHGQQMFKCSNAHGLPEGTVFYLSCWTKSIAEGMYVLPPAGIGENVGDERLHFMYLGFSPPINSERSTYVWYCRHVGLLRSIAETTTMTTA